MEPTRDPNDRRRVDPETQARRDREVLRLRRPGVPFRAIGERLDMSLGSVQKSLVRALKREPGPAATGGPGSVHAALELACDDVAGPEDTEKLNLLERVRLMYLPTEQGRAERARVTAEREAERQRFAIEHADAIAAVGYRRAWDEAHQTRVSDGRSWRDGVDRALSADSDTSATDDDW